jgi:hypothetical protein
VRVVREPGVEGGPARGTGHDVRLAALPCDQSGPEGTCGKPLSGFYEVAVVDENERAVPPNVPGELVFRPKFPNIIFAGYWKRPDATAEAWRNLWMHTGDVFKLDEDGFLYFLDRKKDYLRRRGENVSTWELETTFKEHPAVQEVAVHAVPSDLGEDDIKVTLVLFEGSCLSEEELFHWSAPRLPRFAIPRYKNFMSEHAASGFGRLEEVSEAIHNYNPHRPRPNNLDGLTRNVRQRDGGRWYWHWDPRLLKPTPPALEGRLKAAARKLSTPVLLVRGKRSDVVSVEGAHELVDLAPNARFVDVEGAGHMVASSSPTMSASRSRRSTSMAEARRRCSHGSSSGCKRRRSA